jgi:hypothetical protein
METLTMIVLWMAGHPYVMLSILIGFAILWRLSQVPQYYHEYEGICGVIKFYTHSALFIIVIAYIFFKLVICKLIKGDVPEIDIS